METNHAITKTVLILEDNPEILARIGFLLEKLSHEHGIRIVPVSFPTRWEAEKYLNANKTVFDIVLLDRNDRDGDSYHDIGIERFGPEKIVSISSVALHNDAVQAHGVTRIVQKDYNDLDRFSEKLETVLQSML